MLGKTKFEIKVLVFLKVIDALIFHLLATMLGEHTLISRSKISGSETEQREPDVRARSPMA